MHTGLENWFVNFVQLNRFTQTTLDLANVQNPYLEYGIYWTIKSMQASAYVGGLIVHPAYRYYLLKQLKPETTTPNSTKKIRNLCRRIQGRFLLASFAVGPVLSVLVTKFNGWNEMQLKNKCYDIRRDSNGLTWDRSTVLFAFIGWYWKRFQGAVDGINVAFGYTLVYWTILSKYTNPFLFDKFKPEEMYSSVEEGERNKSKLAGFLMSSEKSSPK